METRCESRPTVELYEAGALVITAGAWAGPLVPKLDHLLVPERQVLGWFQPLQPGSLCVWQLPGRDR